MDVLELRGEISTIIGLHGHERQRPQPINYQLAIDCCLAQVAQSGDLGLGIDYDRLDQELRALMQMAQFRLIESAAAAIIAWVNLTQPIASEVRVALDKPMAMPGRATPRIQMTGQKKKAPARQGQLGAIVFQGDGVQIEWLTLNPGDVLAGPSPAGNIWACPFNDGLQVQGGPWPAFDQRKLTLSAQDRLTNLSKIPISLGVTSR